MIHINVEIEQKIRDRIAELDTARRQAIADVRANNAETPEEVKRESRDYDAARRLEGNIGALEWVLREAGCKL